MTHVSDEAAGRAADHAEIQSEIEKVLRETEAATLSLGGNLAEIVKRSEDFSAAIKQRVGALDAGGEASISNALASQLRTVGSFVQELGRAVGAQNANADRVMETSKSVADAAKSVEAIAFQSRMLCLNTMIEAGRLGDQGRPFMIIAEQMRELSEGIAASNQQISRLASDLGPLLHEIKRSVGHVGAQTKEFAQRFEGERAHIGELTRTLEHTIAGTLGLADERLAALLALSNTALVDLQVQDLVSQRLRRTLRLLAGEEAGRSRPLAAGARNTGPSAAELVRSGRATSGFVSETQGLDGGAGLSAGDATFF
jgi:methyl-accepting chemotaxis protein